MQRRHHYEHAFEAFLRARRIPYVAVDEARKALLPESARLRLAPDGDGNEHTLKSFDFVLYGDPNLLVEIKGRKIARPRGARAARAEEPGQLRLTRAGEPPRERKTRLESWATLEDVQSLSTWEALFGEGFEAVFVFLYWCAEMPPAALFEEVFEHRDRWYAVRAVRIRDYRAHMKTRSPRWGTVHLPASRFDELSSPLAPPIAGLGLPGDQLPVFATI
ncbi:MAG: hypothetical protein EA378_06490 [Phycisphaerales bacterium]|nr:MAG: hypothetical protein EA378_06490 [Phycisphaerales bacterium]